MNDLRVKPIIIILYIQKKNGQNQHLLQQIALSLQIIHKHRYYSHVLFIALTTSNTLKLEQNIEVNL